MSIKKTETGWLVDVQPGGRGGKRKRKVFKTQAEAKAYSAWVITQTSQNPKWVEEKKDKRKLTELVEIWFMHHGCGLRDGERRKRLLLTMAETMGNPLSHQFTTNHFAEYRTKRTAEGITKNSLNHEHAYMRAMFNELSRLGQWKGENPLAKMRQFKIQETELSYLTHEQISSLLTELSNSKNPHVLLIAKICLSTGARWGEAEDLRINQVHSSLIQFARTKSGKVRAVPITEDLESAIHKHYREHKNGQRIFGYSISAFREAVERAGICLPDGQMTHALRHTFASHFMMNGGNILTLQKILGHSTLAMTIRYAHLAPDHLQEAKSLNPLVHTKPKYKLVDLIAETTGGLPRVDGWDAMKPVGQEIL